MTQKTYIFSSLMLVVLIIDQITKYWVYNNIAFGSGEIEVIPGFFSLVHAQNPGAAFGFANDFAYRTWLFLGFTLIAVGVIGDLFRKLPANDRFVSATLGLILGGALGNAWDRLDKGTVTDFLKVYTESEPMRTWLINSPLRSNEWPSFNIADAALVVGVLMFLIHYLFLEEDGEPDQAPAAPDPAES